MKNLISCDKTTIATLADRLMRAKSHAEYQRIQCVLIRATLGSKACEIAQLLGWSAATVHFIHSRFAKEGEAISQFGANTVPLWVIISRHKRGLDSNPLWPKQLTPPHQGRHQKPICVGRRPVYKCQRRKPDSDDCGVGDSAG